MYTAAAGGGLLLLRVGSAEIFFFFLSVEVDHFFLILVNIFILKNYI